MVALDSHQHGAGRTSSSHERNKQDSELSVEEATPESIAVSRMEAELDAVNDRLHRTAQNFSLEWKSFLSYAMEAKQQAVATGSEVGPVSAGGLEDLLLQSHGGLVLVRDLLTRRDRQWQELVHRCGYRHPSLGVNSNPPKLKPVESPPPTPRWLARLLPNLLELTQSVAATAQSVLVRMPIAVDADKGRTPTREELIAQYPALVKQHSEALATHHRLRHALTDPFPSSLENVRIDDVNTLLQFSYLRDQQAFVLECFWLRLKWLSTSHRFHLRQRMLALAHQQKTKHTAQEEGAATRHRDAESRLVCPLFILSAPRFTVELRQLTQQYSLPVPDLLGGGTSDKGDAIALKNSVNELLAQTLGVSQHEVGKQDSTLCLEALVRSHSGSSRWELLQRGYLGDCTTPTESTADDMSPCSSSLGPQIDSLLANEWELLRLEDSGYLQARLDALASAHLNRATVTLTQEASAADNSSMLGVTRPQSGKSNGSVKMSGHDDEDGEPNMSNGATKPRRWDPEALYALYVLRVLSCRSKRLRLLRLLNYFHFVQLGQRSGRNNEVWGMKEELGCPTKQTDQMNSNSPRGTETSVLHPPAPWTVKRCEESGDYIVLDSSATDEKQQVNEHSNIDANRGGGPREHVFSAARQDLEALERQMLRIATIFVRKQEYDSLPAPPDSKSSDADHKDADAGNQAEDVHVVDTIDRLQVLRDIYDCEVAFQEAKLQLVEKLLAGGLQYAPLPQSRHMPAPTTSHAEVQVDALEDILLPVLQRRPLVDFSHPYFFESYAAETVQLELQATLVGQIRQHLDGLEWCSRRELVSSEDDVYTANSAADDQQMQWVCRQILGAQTLRRLYSQQEELLREADDKWLCPTSVGEYHALRHALLEQTMVTWSLLVKVEVPAKPVHYLERNAGDLLSGGGWQLVVPPPVLSDICCTLHSKTGVGDSTENEHSSLVEWLGHALELQRWRQQLALSVYEAHLLERVHTFHFDFVKQTDAAVGSNSGGSDPTRLLFFFFDFAACDRTHSLRPLSMELEAAAASQSDSVKWNSDSRTVARWFEVQLQSSRQQEAGDSHGSEHWRRHSMLRLQQRYVASLAATVRFQDAVGADVFEFAAAYPYVCLAASLSSSGASSSPCERDRGTKKVTVAMDLNKVRAKYAKEITEKMTEEMRLNCVPYWTTLQDLKAQLVERFMTSGTGNSGDEVTLDTVACGRYLDSVSTLPGLLTALNQHLQRLRNEKTLMQSLSPTTRAACAFAPRSTSKSAANRALSGRVQANAGELEETHHCSLTKWLMVKLHQLQVDLQLHERSKVEQLLLTPPAACTPSYSPGPSSSHRLGTRTSPATQKGRSDTHHSLLQAIPSFRYLLRHFATTSAASSAAATASAHVTRLIEQRETTLRALVSIFQAVSHAVELVRVRCITRFTDSFHSPGLHPAGRQSGLTARIRRMSADETPGSGFKRLEHWQTQFHREIRRFLDHIAARLSVGAVVTAGDLFATHPEQLQSRHHAMLMRQEICNVLQDANVHLMHALRCSTSFGIMYTFQQLQDDVGFNIQRRRRLDLLALRSLLDLMGLDKREGVSVSSTMLQALVAAAEKSFSVDVRPQADEREWHAFCCALERQEDDRYIVALTHLMELQWIFIHENCRLVTHVVKADIADSDPLSDRDVEKKALGTLENVWQRLQLTTWDDRSDRGVRMSIALNADALGMQRRVLGVADAGTPFSASSVVKIPSYALRSLRMGAADTSAQLSAAGELFLPPQSGFEHQLKCLRLAMELCWANADMHELQNQYESFLRHRKTHRDNQQRAPALHQTAKTSSSAPSSASMLLGLSKYFHHKTVRSESTASTNVQVSNNSEDAPEANSQASHSPDEEVFVVPVLEMAQFLHDVALDCNQHTAQISQLHQRSLLQLRSHCQQLSQERQTLEHERIQTRRQERIKREAFAIDHAFQLHFEMEALRKQLGVMQTRMDLERETLRCELGAQYDDKLRVMHLELLGKQQQFDEYRTVLQHELQLQLQNAQSHLVDQLVDHSGSLSVATKASLLDSLRGQQDSEKLQRENVALKQTLLKLQTLDGMQQQTHTAARDRELLLVQRHATREALTRSEVTQLQRYAKQLEGDLSKLSQEKTFFQLKWTTAQKQMEAAAQRRRENKIRAISASHIRAMSQPVGSAGVGVDDGIDAFAAIVRANASRPTLERTGRVDDDDSVFEAQFERAIRPRTAASGISSTAEGRQELQRAESQFQNTTRHYQNEIRRLQQHLARETRAKSVMAEQLTQLKLQQNQEDPSRLPGIEVSRQVERLSDSAEKTNRSRLAEPLADNPRRAQTAAPWTPSRPAVLVAAPPGHAKATPRRPRTSFSPRVALLREQVPGNEAGEGPSTPRPRSTSCASRPGTATGSTVTAATTATTAPTRKFQVVKRDANALVGGVAGVANGFSVREPLPYR